MRNLRDRLEKILAWVEAEGMLILMMLAILSVAILVVREITGGN